MSNYDNPMSADGARALDALIRSGITRTDFQIVQTLTQLLSGTPQPQELDKEDPRRFPFATIDERQQWDALRIQHDLLSTLGQCLDRAREMFEGFELVETSSIVEWARSASLTRGDRGVVGVPGGVSVHESSPCSVCGASSVGEPPTAGDASSDPAVGEGVSS